MVLSFCMLLCAATPSLSGSVEVTSARDVPVGYSARVGTSLPVGQVLVGLEAGSRGTLLDTTGLFTVTLGGRLGQLRASLTVCKAQLSPSVELNLRLLAGVSVQATGAWLPDGAHGSVGLSASPGPVSLSVRVDTTGAVTAAAAFTLNR